MALSKEAQKALDVALASQKDRKQLEADMAADAPISNDMKRKLAIALANDKAAADVAQAIDAASGSMSKDTEKEIDIAMSSKKLGDALKAEIKS